jgi:hypothetical protein
MPIVSLDDPSFAGLAYTFKVLPGQHTTETSIWSDRTTKV